MSKHKPPNYWNKEHCQEEALKYTTRKEFYRKSCSAYNSALKNKWLDEICSHMIRQVMPPNYWNYDTCKEEALKYVTRNEFCVNSSAYNVARQNNWLDEICSHMISLKIPSNYWTKELCQIEALKYTNRTDFLKFSNGAFKKAKKSNWLDDICEHMALQGNLRRRLVYVYEFSDNFAYIGLTCNDMKRNRDHFNAVSPVHDHINKTNLTPIKKILTNGYIEVNEAQKQEKYWVTKYKEDGWNILNKAKTGSLGGNILIWTKEKCHEVALTYSSRKELSLANPSVYIAARKNKWLDEICLHMVQKIKPKHFWNYKTCKEAAAQCDSRFEFSRKFSRAYSISLNKNWLDEFFANSEK